MSTIFLAIMLYFKMNPYIKVPWCVSVYLYRNISLTAGLILFSITVMLLIGYAKVYNYFGESTITLKEKKIILRLKNAKIGIRSSTSRSLEASVSATTARKRSPFVLILTKSKSNILLFRNALLLNTIS